MNAAMNGIRSGGPGLGQSGGPSATDLLHAGLARARAGDIEGAGALLDRALQLEPRNPSVLTGRAIIFRVQGRMREAVLACDEALRIEPRLAGAWLERGIVLTNGGSPALARESFAKAAELAPQSLDAHANLAALAARNGDYGEARVAAERALALDSGNLLAATALARVLLADGEAGRVLGLLTPIVDRAGVDEARATALSLLGRAHERLGDYAAAFAHYARSKQDFATFTADIREGRLANSAFIDAIGEGLARTDAAQWSALRAPRTDRPNHIFLLGYPRSGTTLVENVLASIPGVAALEERPTLLETDRRFLLGGREEVAGGVEAFAGLDTAELAPLQDAYWDKVAAAGVSASIDHFVDMDPLKGSRLPFIARLFPDARVVIMRRDPRDVVWSCFRTDFAIANSTLEYVSLDSTARHYDALMRLTETARERLPLQVHELRYEELVADFDRTTQALCDFAGLPWSEDVRRFAATAEQRGVATASSSQVRKGLYDGSRQWEPFAQWLEPVLPILQPWIERFGYA